MPERDDDSFTSRDLLQAAEELKRATGSQLCSTAVPALLEAIEAGEIVLARRHRAERAS